MIYSFCYVLLSALFGILLNYMSNITTNQLSNEILIFLIAAYALITYHLINIRNIRKTYRKLLDINKIDIIILLILITISLTGCFYVPIYFNPSTLSFTFMSISSCCASLSLFLKFRDKHNLWVFLVIFIIIITFYVWHYILLPNLFMFFLMVISTLITGIFSYLYFVKSHEFSIAGLSAVEILTFRFWLLFIILGIVCIINGDFLQLTWSILFKIFCVSLLVLVLPIYFSQKGIEKIGPNMHGIILGFTPLLSYILENLILKIHDMSMMFFSTALALTVLAQKLFIKS